LVLGAETTLSINSSLQDANRGIICPLDTSRGAGMARGWDKCFSAAGNICGASGYDVLDRSDEAAAVGSASGSRGSFGAAYVQTNERSMLVACKVNKPAG
jgi:hypothetical protein